MEPSRRELSPRAASSGRLRVLLDARKLGDGGIGVYLENLISGLTSNGNIDLTLLILDGEENSKALGQYSWVNHVEYLTTDIPPYSLRELFLLGGRISWEHFDVFHVPHFTLPFGVKVPSVITIHDLIHIHEPEKAYYPWIARPYIRSSMKRASRVVTVSQATCDAVSQLGQRRKRLLARLRMVPNAIDPYFTEPDRLIEQSGNRFAQYKPFFLGVVSQLKPHKGLEDLLAAFVRLKTKLTDPDCPPELKHFSDLRLLLAGHGVAKMVAVERLLDDVGGLKGVHLIGEVSKAELAQLYLRAEALVVPSKAEGFCLPLLEAHALGTPAVLRPVPAVLEQVSTYDVRCEDMSQRALCAGMEEFLKRNASRDHEEMKSSLSSRARSYDALDIARTVEQVYQEALEVSRS